MIHYFVCYHANIVTQMSYKLVNPWWQYSETCIRRSPLGPNQLAVIQRWPAYRLCVEIS